MNVIADFPAYDIVAYDGQEFDDGAEFALPFQSRRYGTLYKMFKLGYCAEGEERDRAVRLGHEVYFAFGLAVSITAWDRPKERYVGLEYGDRIRFAGKVFELKPAPNQNVKLIEVA